MANLDLISLLNKCHHSSATMVGINYIIDVMKRYKKTRIFFGLNRFETEDQESIKFKVNIERHINSCYLGILYGSFDYIELRSNDINDCLLIFPERCAKRAYALYMFFLNGYRLSTIFPEQYLDKELRGKTYSDLNFYQAHTLLNYHINCNSYVYYDNEVSSSELDWIEEYLNGNY